jgi:tetratricopeptide (TPR) repeat protein
LNPNYVGGWEFRGATHFQRGEYQPALDDFLEALRLNPSSSYSSSMAGQAAGKLGKMPQLIEALSRHLAAEPENALLLERRGENYARMESWKEALADYSAASRLQPEVGRLHFYRTSFHLSLGDLPAALSSAEAALTCADLDVTQRRYLAIMTALGKPDDATAGQRLRELPDAGDAGWPGPVVRFLRKELSYEEAMKSAQNDQERAELRTYAGWSDLNNGRVAAGRAHLEWMSREGDRSLMEFHLARLLLQQIKPAASAASEGAVNP